jgi:hypothetical protein
MIRHRRNDALLPQIGNEPPFVMGKVIGDMMIKMVVVFEDILKECLYDGLFFPVYSVYITGLRSEIPFSLKAST